LSTAGDRPPEKAFYHRHVSMRSHYRYLVSGDVPNADQLAHRTLGELAQTSMALRLNTPATRIDPDERRVIHRDGELALDALIVATGATPIRPDLPRLDLPGVHVLHMEDGLGT
jgi:NADPH-dependent 2,4-dienoyl-CoA reductase/sulfur reductase-like enzyme